MTAQGQANEKMDGLVQQLVERCTALEKLVGEREAAVAKRENAVGQRELNFKKRQAEFDGRGFWGHFGHAFLSLSKSQMGAGFGIRSLADGEMQGCREAPCSSAPGPRDHRILR